LGRVPDLLGNLEARGPLVQLRLPVDQTVRVGIASQDVAIQVLDIGLVAVRGARGGRRRLGHRLQGTDEENAKGAALRGEAVDYGHVITAHSRGGELFIGPGNRADRVLAWGKVERVVAPGVGGRADLARIQLAVVIDVAIHGPAGEARLGGVLDAVGVQ